MRRRLALLALIVGGGALVLFPIYWLLITAFKPSAEILALPPTFFPHEPTLVHFEQLFTDHGFGRYLFNSLVVVSVSVLSALTLGTLAAYGLARYPVFGGRNETVKLAVLVTRMVPAVILVVPVFLMVSGAGLLNTYWGLIAVYTAIDVPLVMWMVGSFLEDFPPDLEEAAMTDGASRLHALRTVLLPLLAPGLAAAAVFAVIVTYNEYLLALVLTSTPDAQPVSVGTGSFISRSGTDYGGVAAAATVALLPILVLAGAAQRHLARGLTAGSFR